jgi:hypothetical protein
MVRLHHRIDARRWMGGCFLNNWHTPVVQIGTTLSNAEWLMLPCHSVPSNSPRGSALADILCR